MWSPDGISFRAWRWLDRQSQTITPPDLGGVDVHREVHTCDLNGNAPRFAYWDTSRASEEETRALGRRNRYVAFDGREYRLLSDEVIYPNGVGDSWPIGPVNLGNALSITSDLVVRRRVAWGSKHDWREWPLKWPGTGGLLAAGPADSLFGQNHYVACFASSLQLASAEIGCFIIWLDGNQLRQRDLSIEDATLKRLEERSVVSCTVGVAGPDVKHEAPRLTVSCLPMNRRSNVSLIYLRRVPDPIGIATWGFSEKGWLCREIYKDNGELFEARCVADPKAVATLGAAFGDILQDWRISETPSPTSNSIAVVAIGRDEPVVVTVSTYEPK
jgi:hypothetical protein